MAFEMVQYNMPRFVYEAGKKVRKKVEKKGGKKRQEGGVVWESLRNN